MSTVLIVEDHAMSRQVLKTLLGYMEHRVLEATDGLEALEIARAQRPDLIITDIEMPGMDGVELLRLLRSEEGIADTPVIVYTATYRVPQARSMVEACSICRVIAKPAEPSFILQNVNEMLGIAPFDAASPPKSHPDVLISESAGLQLATMMDLSFNFASQHDLSQLAGIFCRAAQTILKCRQVLLAVTEEDGRTLYFTKDSDQPSGVCPIKGLPEAAILKQVANERSTLRKRSTPGENTEGSSFISLLAVPFATRGRLHGWVCALDRVDQCPFSDEDEEIAVALSAQAALAYENILLVRQLQGRATELAASQARLERILRSSNDGYWDWNVRTDDVFVSSRWCEIVGLQVSKGQVCFEDIKRLLHPEDLPKMLDALLPMISGHSGSDSYRQELRHLGPDGGVVWVYVRGTVTERDEQGKALQVSGATTDITERKQAQERERELDAHKRAFYRRTILAATQEKLVISEKQEIDAITCDSIKSWRIEDGASFEKMRDEIRVLMRAFGMDEPRAYRFLGCVVEAATNALKHASGGDASLFRREDSLIFVMADTGPGIGALALPDVALTKYYSTAGTLGMGYKLMIEFADRVYLATGPEGTTVAIEMAVRCKATKGPADAISSALS